MITSPVNSCCWSRMTQGSWVECLETKPEASLDAGSCGASGGSLLHFPKVSFIPSPTLESCLLPPALHGGPWASCIFVGHSCAQWLISASRPGLVLPDAEPSHLRDLLSLTSAASCFTSYYMLGSHTPTPPSTCLDLYPGSHIDLPSPRSPCHLRPTQDSPTMVIPHHWTVPPVTTSSRLTTAHLVEDLPHFPLALPPHTTPSVGASTPLHLAFLTASPAPPLTDIWGGYPSHLRVPECGLKERPITHLG